MRDCPSCGFEYSYQDGNMMVCASCQFKWAKDEPQLIVKDFFGNRLKDGDTVIVIKDLKVKGASSDLKQGTKVTGIKLVDKAHNIDCKIPGFGQMSLKSEFVKKA